MTTGLSETGKAHETWGSRGYDARIREEAGARKIHSRFRCDESQAIFSTQLAPFTINRKSIPKMNSGVTRILLLVVAVFLAAEWASAKSIESPDPEPYQKNQVEMGTDDFPLDNALFKYILARELLNRQRSYDLENRQRKRNYWKQCAFNAVSCFGKK